MPPLYLHLFPSLSVGEFKTGGISISQISFFKHKIVWVNSRQSKNHVQVKKDEKKNGAIIIMHTVVISYPERHSVMCFLFQFDRFNSWIVFYVL